jgi:hypothetical protein
MEGLAATDRVRVLDLKAYYRGTVVDLEPDRSSTAPSSSASRAS